MTPASRTLLCYGDSNTHGTLPLPDLDTMGRMAPAERWTTHLARLLPEWEVIAEGLPGRTTVHDDPIEGARRNGMTILPAILERLGPVRGRYFEPFIGGAALFFRTAPTRAVISDMNPDLVGLYRAVAADADGVIRRLRLHREAHDREHYYEMRTRWNDASVSWSAVDRAAAFVYLNKTCFNGLWRVNRAGHFNVPMGSYTEPPICVPEALLAAATVLRRADIRLADFRTAVAGAGAAGPTGSGARRGAVARATRYTGAAPAARTLDDM